MSPKPKEPELVGEKIGDLIKKAEANLGAFEDGLNTTDTQKAQAKFDEFARSQHERRKNDMRQALKTVEVRRVFYDLIAEAKPYAGSFNRDALVMAFNEGRRDIGLAILNLILEAEPGAYIQMQREHASNLKEEGRRRAKLREEANV